MIEIDNNKLSGKREEILKILKKKANPSCNTCFGRGHVGYKENKDGSREYISCGKCIQKTKQLPPKFSIAVNKKKRKKY